MLRLTPSDPAETLSRAEWWELLFFVRKLEVREQDELTRLVQQEQAEQLSELDEEGLIQLSVSVELAQKVLQVLEKRCQGSTLSDLRGSHVYAKYFLGRGAEQDGGGSTVVSSEDAGCRNSSPEAVVAEAAEEDLPAVVLPPRAPATVEKSDSQLFSELLQREGLLFPEVTEEQSKLFGISKGASKRGSLVKIVDVVDVMQRSSSEVGLRLAGLKHILKILEEEAGLERQVGKAQGGLGTREKVVKMAVELLSTEVAEKALVVLTLRLLAVLMVKYDWRVPFATEGGVRAVLACMQQHAASTVVQQAGLAALKVLVGAGSGEAGGASGKPSPLNHADAQMMREIFASIGSASSEGSASLLSAIPAAMSTMQRVAGGSSGVRNGLLVVNMLIDSHRGLAEQLVSCDLPAVLRSCWWDGQSTGCPNKTLALSVIHRLVEHEVPVSLEMAGAEAPLDLGDVDVRTLVGSLWEGGLSREAVVALEQHLCGKGTIPSGEAAQLLQDRECFVLLLRSFKLLGAEKAASLSVLRILHKFLDGYREDLLPWHECVEPCLSSMSAHSNDQEVVQEVVRFLHRLATASKDCAVVMCRVGTHEALGKALDKHSAALPLAPALRDLVSDCEKYASLYRKLTTSILAGCIQLVLGQIEEHRRSHQPISIPFFDVFLRNLCRGSSVEVKEDKCWEKVQVSSNPHRASKLTDRNPKTYWESNGSTGSHSITVYMQCGVVIREMSMLVASEDSSYMPARVVVLGGDSPANINTVLNAVTILPSDSRVILLENMTRFWPIIQIRVKRCQQQVVQEVVRFLHRLATASKDCAVVMCRVGTHEALGKALDKHSAALPLAPALRDLVSDCEKYASLYRKLTTSILAGCIQLVLGQIEEHRRSHQPISIPFFDVFLRNLCRGSSVEVKEDKCWEKVQVSSNPHRASKLTDRNPKTYWESNGSTGSHSITVYMQCGVVIREMSMLVASEDSSYMPARVVVLGGDSPANINTVLNAVTILPSDSRVILLENMTRFWPIIQIRVKRCQQGGIDTRVRGIEVLGPKPTFWPVFKEQLCRRTFLFCTARAHAWCQEICQDRERLLHLFGRLNRALRHEQAFADRFLPDDEAAQALGRTYWEALVNPLVQSITSPDPSGISPLAWLLSKYLESVELPRRAMSCNAVFSSRVRRLTQLLVHVDPSGAELEEARAPGRAGGKDGKNKEVPAGAAKVAAKKPSGLWGISQCWRGVVQQQVQRFLEAAWQAPDVVERYCRLYQCLRSATAELFGQQAAFALALAQGFAGALLQLSFLTALHVSEQFARYLDRQMQELHGVVGSTGPLQQILEPFVVFCGLELAHTFEHFYRYYLGDRLLAQGPSWLEAAVVEQLGLCFPSRFPQQMLSNLAESEELQQQFYLFQLQEQDKQLLELDTGLESPEAEALGEASLAEAPEVKVLVLSPRCWPISPFCYMDEPGRFFSASLSSPLAKFADFWRQSQSQLGWECTKPRRLQWTWLGHAELQFGDCILHVSTLQMYVLLHFNSVEEVAVDALLQATGLPVDLVHHALTPLTHSEGVLVQSCTQGAPGTLRLNRAALAQASGRCLRLLPQQPYLRAEMADGSALERKRNVLCCLITRILKAEKQLHIDNLVFRVIDACGKGKFGPGLQFLSFCCHSVDVLSCVLHLLNLGYLRRQEGSSGLG
nr:PREDICTED: cullin-9-like [Apteryx mantelli mantelli]